MMCELLTVCSASYNSSTFLFVEELNALNFESEEDIQACYGISTIKRTQSVCSDEEKMITHTQANAMRVIIVDAVRHRDLEIRSFIPY